MLYRILFIFIITFLISPWAVSKTENDIRHYSLVEELPHKGEVYISGTVVDTDGQNELTLKDAQGKEINVESDKDIKVDEGDRVDVRGKISGTFAGIGIEVTQAQVNVTGRSIRSQIGLNNRVQSRSDMTDYMILLMQEL